MNHRTRLIVAFPQTFLYITSLVTHLTTFRQTNHNPLASEELFATTRGRTAHQVRSGPRNAASHPTASRPPTAHTLFEHARTASAMDMDYKWFMSSPRSTRDSLLTCHHRRRAHSSSAQVSEREDKGGRETASPKNKRHHTHTDTHRIHLHIHLYPTSR